MVKIFLKFVAKLLDGKKTIIGLAGIFLLLVARLVPPAVGVLAWMFPDLGLPEMEIDQAIQELREGYNEIIAFCTTGAIAGIGIADKIRKNRINKKVEAPS